VVAQPAQRPDTHISPEVHAMHAAPPAPHAVGVTPGTHAFPLQQPVHDDASHTHAPETQCCPVPHAAPVPQRQAPAPSQPSAMRASHARHAAPGAAQLVPETGVHVVPEQQPLGQDVASHTHAPCEQC
jgi:hypothetical protein